MKKLIRKIHHFTKRELVIEEVIIIVIFCLLAAAAFAASAILPIRATVIQCGSRGELQEKCREEQRCCDFLKMINHQKNLIKQGREVPEPPDEGLPAVVDTDPKGGLKPAIAKPF